MATLPHLIFDFDGTFINCETLDELARVALKGRSDAEEIQQEIADITALGMNGDIPFRESISRRLALVQLNETIVHEVTNTLMDCISPSILNRRSFFEEHADRIYIISNGFKKIIEPIAAQVGIKPDHVFASIFEYDEAGVVTGVEESILLEEGGKGKQLKALGLGPHTIVIGDGYTDYLMKEVGGADTFIAYCEFTRRDKVVAASDHVAQNFDDVLAIT